MEWRDEAIVIGLRRQGESSAILEAFTRDHGRHCGMVRGGRSPRLQPVLQPGNRVELTWRARLEDQLGHFTVEPLTQRSAQWMGNAAALYAVGIIAEWLRVLPERDPHPRLHDLVELVMAHLARPGLAPVLLVRFELALLSELGFGLDLSSCAVTGSTQDLRYVSPRTGRAVSARAGEPYADRLLPLPRFLGLSVDETVPQEELRQGLALTGHFLERNVSGPRGEPLPAMRARLVESAPGI